MNYQTRNDGQTIEGILRRREVNLSGLANKLGVNRGRLYTWFRSEHLRPEIIHQIAEAVDYDFSLEFPELHKHFENRNGGKSQYRDFTYKDKYIELLEKFRILLESAKYEEYDSNNLYA